MIYKHMKLGLLQKSYVKTLAGLKRYYPNSVKILENIRYIGIKNKKEHIRRTEYVHVPIRI